MNIDFMRMKIERATQPPEWASLVERWYQLDPAAYGLADSFWAWREQLQTRPEFIVLASPGASNATDFEFTHSGASHAAKFVHTLPNVRGTSLYQVMNWSGPMLCLQNGERTLLSALGEAMDEYAASPREIWVFAALQDTEVMLWRLHAGESAKMRGESVNTDSSHSAQFDSDLVAWLTEPKSPSFKWADANRERALHAR